MDEESKQLLRDQLKILKKINRHFVYQSIWGTIKIIVIIGFLIFGAIQLQPYLDQILGAFSQIQGLGQGLGQQGINLEQFLR